MYRKLLTVAVCLFAGLALMLPASAQTTKRFTTKFEVSITKRANALQAPFQVLGELAMDVAADGTFTCEITPLKDLTDIPQPLSVVLVAGAFVVDGPAKLPCSGQVNGRIVGITIDMSSTYKIYGTGVLPGSLADVPAGPLNMSFGGTASTSTPGEGGDWFTKCVTVRLYNPFTGELIVDKTVCISITAN